MVKEVLGFGVKTKVLKDENGILFSATIDEFPDVEEFAETEERAISLIKDTIETTKEVFNEKGMNFPTPKGKDN